MPKIPKESASSFVWRMKETFPTELHVDDDCNLNCIHCKLPIPVRTFFQVKQHLQTAKHRQNAGRNEILAVQNSNGTSSPQVDLATQELLQFNRDLFAMLQSAAIPISKVSNQKFTQFIEKYTRYTLPNELTLHQTCAFAAYESCITKLKCKASNAYIWVSLSETTDSKERKIINFVFGILGERSEHGKSYLLNIQVLKEVNEDAIVKFFTDSLQLIWPRVIKSDNVLLVLTEASPYMRDAMSKLADVFPKMIHVNCLARDLQHISESVRMNSVDAEALICRVAFAFGKTPSHRHQFSERNPKVPFPPQSTHFTQWNTFIEAAIYYANNFETVKETVRCISDDDTEGVKRAYNAFSLRTVKTSLAFIKANFNTFVNAINKIQKRGISLAESIELVDQVYEPTITMKSPVFRNTFDRLFENNPGYIKLKAINLVHVYSPDDSQFFPDFDAYEAYSPTELALYAMAPIAMCNVERDFPAYISVLSDQGVPPSQLKEHVIVYCNDI